MNQPIPNPQTVAAIQEAREKRVGQAKPTHADVVAERDQLRAQKKLQCVCGEFSLGVVHRADGPCYFPDAQQPAPKAVPLKEEKIEDCIDSATRKFRSRRQAVGGQQVTSYHNWHHWFAREVEAAHNITAPKDRQHG